MNHIRQKFICAVPTMESITSIHAIELNKIFMSIDPIFAFLWHFFSSIKCGLQTARKRFSPAGNCNFTFTTFFLWLLNYNALQLIFLLHLLTHHKVRILRLSVRHAVKKNRVIETFSTIKISFNKSL
jgi:hypothetical protein